VDNEQNPIQFKQEKTDWFVSPKSVLHEPTFLALVDGAELTTTHNIILKFKRSSKLIYKKDDNKPRLVFDDSDILK